MAHKHKTILESHSVVYTHNAHGTGWEDDWDVFGAIKIGLLKHIWKVQVEWNVLLITLKHKEYIYMFKCSIFVTLYKLTSVLYL